MSEPRVLREATFDQKVKSYWIWQPVLVLSLLIVTIPLAIVYAIIARFVIDHYLANLSCTLTERTLDIKKGILNKTESTIPLEKITDLQLFQGPIMRHFGLHGFKVETAGQSNSGAGSLVNIVGITDTKEFRKAVLAQRDRIHDRESSAPTPAPASAIDNSVGPRGEQLLAEIRDTLVRIEERLDTTPRG
ncbi:MAG: PH domain-containing protein [Phycisphaerales bacterium]